MGKLELDAITHAHLHDYVRWRKGDGIADATINQDLATVKHMFTHAVDIGAISSNPIERFKKLRVEQKAIQRFTDDQVQAVIDAARPDCRPIFVFIRETGCRHDEATSLEWKHVHEESRQVAFTDDTKSRKHRYVGLTDAAIEAINTLPRLKGCPHVFYNLKNKKRWAKYCRKPWNEAREKAGLPNLQVKYLRSHYSIGLSEDGAAMHDIKQALGHSSVATTERYYAQFSPDHSSRRILKVLEGGKGPKRDHLSQILV